MSIFNKIFSPKSPEGWVEKGNKLKLTGKGTANGAIRSEVMRYYAEALKIDPDFIPALLGIAECLIQEGISQYSRELFDLPPSFGGEEGCMNMTIDFCDKVLSLKPCPFDVCSALIIKSRCYYYIGEDRENAMRLLDEADQMAKTNNLDGIVKHISWLKNEWMQSERLQSSKS